MSSSSVLVVIFVGQVMTKHTCKTLSTLAKWARVQQERQAKKSQARPKK